MLGVVFLCLIVLVTEIAAVSIEDVPTSSMTIASSLQGIFGRDCDRHTHCHIDAPNTCMLWNDAGT